MSLPDLLNVDPCLIVGVGINWDNKNFTDSLNNNKIIYSVDKNNLTDRFYENDDFFYGMYNGRAYVIQKAYFKPAINKNTVNDILQDFNLVNRLPKDEEWYAKHCAKIDHSKYILAF